jgi:mannose-6-phosphate isomerase-like protein (cupin superfamily)
MAQAIKVSKQQAIRSDWGKMKSWNAKFPVVRGGTSVVVAEFEGPHGKVRTRKDRERIYYILEGKGEFEVEDEKIPVSGGDVVVIPPGTWYNYRPTDGKLKVLVIMDLWNS